MTDEQRGGNRVFAIVAVNFFFLCAAALLAGALEIPYVIQGPVQTAEQKALLAAGACLALGGAFLFLATLVRKMVGLLLPMAVALIVVGFVGLYHFGPIIWHAVHG